VLQKTVLVRAIGAVEAYSTIVVKSQAEGELMRVHFKEGQDVKKGDPFFAIDPRPFEAALRQVEANLARDTAQAKNAEVDARRYAELLQRRLVAQADYDQQRTNADALQAAVRAHQAAVDIVARQTLPATISTSFQGTAQAFQASLQGLGMLLRMTILSGLPSAGSARW
jgi:multidrug efflux system membrane fusion protein